MDIVFRVTAKKNIPELLPIGGGIKMKKKMLTVAIFLIFISTCAYAATLNVGGKALEIPNPQGFSVVTPEMKGVYRWIPDMMSPEIDQLTIYIPDADIPESTNNEMYEMQRYFTLTIYKVFKEETYSTEKFSDFKDIVKKENKEKIDSISSQVFKNNTKDPNKKISNAYDVALALQKFKSVPLEPHYETDNAISMSTFNDAGTTEGGEKKLAIYSITTTIINVAGKIIYLNCVGLTDEVEWTRSASKFWAENIMNNNPAPEKSSEKRLFDLSNILSNKYFPLVVLAIAAFSFFRKLRITLKTRRKS